LTLPHFRTFVQGILYGHANLVHSIKDGGCANNDMSALDNYIAVVAAKIHFAATNGLSGPVTMQAWGKASTRYGLEWHSWNACLCVTSLPR